MPEISELVLSMVKPLVEFPDDVRIDVSESDEFMEYTLRESSRYRSCDR